MRRMAVWVLLVGAGLFFLPVGCKRTERTRPEPRSQQPALLGDPSREKGSWQRPAKEPPNLSNYVIKLAQMETFYDVPGEYGYLLEGHKHGFDSLSFILTETHPGGGPPLHTHVTEEAHVLLEGSVNYIVGEKTFTAQGPYVARVPAGVPHTFINAGDRVLRIVAAFPDKKISYNEIGKNPLVKKNP